MQHKQLKQEGSTGLDRDNAWAFVLLAVLILATYANTFHASWQFDDKPNILNNSKLHLVDLAPTSLWETFFAQAGKDIFFRPLPSLSLALNWYIAQNSTFGYHLVNTAIHLLTAFMLFLASKHLLQSPKMKKRYAPGDVFFISFLSAVLWAVNPIQIQAVTYIVQRMASMAALFYICGIYFYVKVRLGSSGKIQVWHSLACFMSFVFAMLSKENTAVFPFSLIIIEFLFFQDVDLYKQVRARLPVLITLGVLVILSGIVLIKAGALEFLLGGYESRPFTLMERLLTQPRIILHYISQIFYPLPSRMSITHDVIVSTSLFSPWTTLPAILVIMAMIGFGISQIRSKPLVSLAILFFFLNHVVESTFIPLELVFEHRNYLPSFFLFLPIAATLKSVFNYYNFHNRAMYAILVSSVTLVIIGLGCFTYVRNLDWRTESSLWQDAMQKAPLDARPLVNLAIQLAWSPNPTPLQYDAALGMLKKAMSLNTARDFLVSDIVNNIGSIHYQRGNYEKAVETFRKGLLLDPGFLKMRYDLINALIMQGQWEAASKEADLLLNNKKRYIKAGYYAQKGFILLWQNQAEAALPYFGKTLQMEPGNMAAMLNAGVALGLAGRGTEAESVLKRVVANTDGDMRPFLALIENSARANDFENAEKYAAKLLAEFGVKSVLEGIDSLSMNYRTAPMSKNIVLPLIEQTLLHMVRDLETSFYTMRADCDRLEN